MKDKKSLRRDIAFVGVIFLIGAAVAAAVLLLSKPGGSVEIRRNGQVQTVLPLEKDTRLVLKDESGSNTLVIENGQAWIEQADCPDGLCMKTGKISRTGQSIICLPHRLSVEIVGETSPSDVDVIVK